MTKKVCRKDVANKLKECIAYTKLFLLDHMQKEPKFSSDPETYAFFAESAKKTAQPPIAQNLLHKSLLQEKQSTTSYSVKQYGQEKPIPKKAHTPPQKKTPLPETPKEPDIHETHTLLAPFDPIKVPYLQILPSSKANSSTSQQPIYLNDIKKKVQKLKRAPKTVQPLDDSEAKACAFSWKKIMPHCMILSFFTKESEEGKFLEKVIHAMNTQLFQTSYIAMPSSQTLAQLLTASATKTLKYAIVAYSQESYPNAFEWMHKLKAFSFEDKMSKSTQILDVWGVQESTHFLHLPLRSDQVADAAFKADLWHGLKKL